MMKPDPCASDCCFSTVAVFLLDYADCCGLIDWFARAKWLPKLILCHANEDIVHSTGIWLLLWLCRRAAHTARTERLKSLQVTLRRGR